MSGPDPSRRLERCALRAQLRGDPMIGTAFPAARILLVEQPGAWGRRGLRDSGFPAEIAADLERRANAAGLRVQLIRRVGRDSSTGSRAWALVDTRAGGEAAYWGTFDDPAELANLSLDGSGGVRDDRPVYLVCAHSKHDTCCALRGRPVAAALDAIRPGQVWETSHLGGDRFAANVLVLPGGLQYGRVLHLAAADLVEAAETDRVLVDLLRGRVGVHPAGQAALAHAHRVLGLTQRSDLTVVGVSGVQAGIATVELAAPTGPVEVAVRVDRVPADGLTCQNPGPNAFWRYTAVGLTG